MVFFFFLVFTFRMESIFRLLLHDLSLLQGDHSDPKLLSAIDFHRRDLATILETTKWQVFTLFFISVHFFLCFSSVFNRIVILSVGRFSKSS